MALWSGTEKAAKNKKKAQYPNGIPDMITLPPTACTLILAHAMWLQKCLTQQTIFRLGHRLHG